MNKICETCDTRNRLKLCQGKNENFKYCFRRSGSVSNIPDSITTFNTLQELISKANDKFDWVKTETLRIEPYGEHINILIGEFIDGNIAPVGYIITG